MDIKEIQKNIDGTLAEIVRLVSKKFSDISPLNHISQENLLKNINHTIRSWEKYVDIYIKSKIALPLTRYDIDIVNLILYIFKIYGKMIDYQFTTNNSLFLESYTKLKEIDILYQNIVKINSQFNLTLNLNLKHCPKDVKYQINTMINNIINIIKSNIIEYQLSTITTSY